VPDELSLRTSLAVTDSTELRAALAQSPAGAGAALLAAAGPGASLDALLLSQPSGSAGRHGVLAWGPRCADASPYDQLRRDCPEDAFALQPKLLAELFARARAHPDFWTPARLAEFYGTKPEWVQVLLESTAPPVLVLVDGSAYGVFDIRSTEELK
jgi:hypothetical protein